MTHYSESQAIREAIESASRVLVITHLDPDGDALGSLTAVGQALQQFGLPMTMAVDGGMMHRFTYLPLADLVQHSADPDTEYDLIIAVDCGDAQRMGQVFIDLPEPHPTIINIDHHITNTNFGTINLVEQAASATEILTGVFEDIGVEISADVGMSLLTGLVTDTLGFSTLSVTTRTFEIASQLMHAGADLPAITMQALNLKPLSTLKVYNIGLTNMKMKDGLIWTTISKAERQAIGYNGVGSSGLVSMMGNVDTAAISAVLTEMDNGRVAVSFRCRPPYDVSEMARDLGGGGHPLAAGCSLDGPLANAEALIVDVGRRAIRATDSSS